MTSQSYSDGASGDSQRPRTAESESGDPELNHGGLPILADGPPPLPPTGSMPRIVTVEDRLRAGVQHRADASAPALKEGRYLGGDSQLRVELRADGSGAGVISGEVAVEDGGSGRYLASFRTEPGTTVSLSDGRWAVIAEDADGSNATGQLTLQRHGSDSDALFGSITLDAEIAGLPSETPLLFALRYRGHQFRALGLEIESERGVDGLPTVQFRGQPMNLERAWENAGIIVRDTGQPNDVPPPLTPWGTAQLHGLMHDLAQSNLDAPGWALRLLWLSKSARDGLLGVMFDDSGTLPRQGLAVFATEIRSRRPRDADRKLIQTTVHEIGHALNLAHRFERAVGRADSTSFMNYDWRYLGGRAANLFWDRFEYRFDPDEIEFLRHGPRHAIVPGGAGFHQVRYWPPANSGYSPYGREARDRELELRILPVPNGGVFAFGQPVLLGLALRNISSRNIKLPKFVLDAKAGFIEFTIKPERRGDRGEHREILHFHSIMVRNFDVENARTVTLRPGRVLEDNVNLTFGGGGFSFPEPGSYRVTAHLVFTFDVQPDDPVDLITSSQEISLRVAYPHSMQDERDAAAMLNGDAGTYIALGGSRVLSATADRLAEIAERRLSEDSADPIGTTLRRCQGIDAGRAYLRFESGRFREVDGNAAESARLLGTLTDGGLACVDTVTAKATRSLGKKQQGRAIGKK